MMQASHPAACRLVSHQSSSCRSSITRCLCAYNLQHRRLVLWQRRPSQPARGARPQLEHEHLAARLCDRYRISSICVQTDSRMVEHSAWAAQCSRRVPAACMLVHPRGLAFLAFIAQIASTSVRACLMPDALIQPHARTFFRRPSLSVGLRGCSALEGRASTDLLVDCYFYDYAAIAMFRLLPLQGAPREIVLSPTGNETKARSIQCGIATDSIIYIMP